MSIRYVDTIPFIPNITEAEVIKVYDGDTITIGFFYPGSETPDRPYRMSVRLLGIDTPEMKGKSPEEKAKAKQAQSFLSSQILGKKVKLTDVALEKYGRLLANVHCDGVHINKLMIDNNYAVSYDGGHKSEFTL
jgi:micrococcal nuclease